MDAGDMGIMRELTYSALMDCEFSTYPYQDEAIDKIRSWVYEDDHKAGILQMATGTGKTVTVGILIRQLIEEGLISRALFAVHRTELVKQAIDTFELCGLMVGREQGSHHGFALGDPHVVCTTVQSMTKRCKRYQPNDFQLIITDECFPAGTLVDGIPIERICNGDLVATFNESSREIEMKSVKKKLVSIPSELMTVRFSNGSAMTVTPNHPVFSRDREWVKACDLSPGDMVYGWQMQGMRESDTNSTRALPSNMLERVSRDRFFSKNGSNKPEVCVWSHEVQQSNEEGGGSREAESQAKGDRLEAPSARGEREGYVGCRKDSVGSDWPDSYHGLNNAGIAATLQDSESLQNRFGLQGYPVSSRGRWSIAQLDTKKRAGSAKGGLSEFARVESVAFHEQTGDGTFGGLCEGGVTYNLEVEGNNNYFANGVLVHNCHHAGESNKTYSSVYDHFPDAKLVGVTATIDRPDGQSLKRFEEVVYSYSLYDAIHDPAGPFLSPVKFVRCSLGVDLRGCKTTGKNGDFAQGDLGRKIQPAIELLANAISKEIEDRKKIIVFMPDVGSSIAMADALKQLGHAADWVSGDKPDRDNTIMRYKNGLTKILVNCQILTEGFDDKPTDCVVLKPTRSRIAYAQMVGRGTRLCKGKSDCLILDFSHTTDMDLIGPSSLTDCEEVDSKRAEELVEEGVDLWQAVERAKTERKQRQEIKVPVARLDMSYRRVEINPFELAASLGVSRAMLTNANRFGELATPAQKDFLNKSGMADVNNMTKRQASQLIGQIIDRRNSGLCSIKQLNYLISLGMKPEKARGLQFGQAAEAIQKYRSNQAGSQE
jgi:superfamily II DNA or RNA helicase